MTRKNTELDPLAEATVTDEGEAGPLIRADTWKSWGNAIELRDGYLVVDTRTSVEQVDVRPSREMLFEFASLQRASDDVAIRDFARIYGLLDLCSHHLSAGHPLAVGFNSTDVPLGLLNRGVVRITEPCQPLSGEPVATWRFWSAQAAAALRVIASVKLGRPRRIEDWYELSRPGPWVPEVINASLHLDSQEVRSWEVPGELAVDRRLAGAVIDTWLDLAGARLTVDWEARRPEVRLATHGLFGSLGAQVLAAAAGVDSLALCSDCGNGHRPMRPGATQWATYCPQCRKDGVPAARASKAYRLRNKENPNREKQPKGPPSPDAHTGA